MSAAAPSPAARPTGLRKTSPEALAAAGHARRYREGGLPPVTRTAALALAKRAAAALGLKAAKIALVDQLFACSKAADWTTPGIVPIVWPSNLRLARSLGISVSTMKHHLNGLVRAGLVAYSDGPTYQRGGRRDASGAIVEGCGIDLSPIAARFAELTELVEAVEAEARAWTKASYRRTVLRKAVQSLILSACERGTVGPWDQAQARLDAIREQRPTDLAGIEAQLAALEALSEELETLYLEAEEEKKFQTALTKFRPDQTTAEHSDSEPSKHRQPRANARDSHPLSAFGDTASEIIEGGFTGSVGAGGGTAPALAASAGPDFSAITLPLVRDACPRLSAFVPDALESWSALRESGRDLCLAAGINPQVWQEARQALGQDLAVAAVALTVQRSADGRVDKPGAYLRTLVQRGRAGRLHIDRSLMAMAKAAGADREEGADAGDPSLARRRGADGERAGTRSFDLATHRRSPNAPSPGRADPDREGADALDVFPSAGTVRFSRFAEVIRANAPRPTPDPDLVAEAFRRFLKERRLAPTGRDLDRLLAAFCRKWRMN